MSKSIAFITWDGAEANYLEGLFLPIFKNMQTQFGYEFHILQFSWQSAEKVAKLQQLAADYGFHYLHFDVATKPIASIAKYYSLFKQYFAVKNYLNQYKVDWVMPRSTMPALLLNQIKLSNSKLVFDADGLAIEEKVDFEGLSTSSFLYKLYKNAEKRAIQKADKVIVRTAKAIQHFEKDGHDKNKFHIVLNGKNEAFFKPIDYDQLAALRTELGLAEKAKIFLYCGSIGKQYRPDIMFQIFDNYLAQNPQAIFVILTASKHLITPFIHDKNRANILIKKVENAQVPLYINAADICFGIRQYSYSMQGVSPIKLGEYLLCGTPIIASKGIGDTDEILANLAGVYLIDNDNFDMQTLLDFIHHIDKSKVQTALSYRGKQYYSLQLAAASYHAALS